MRGTVPLLGAVTGLAHQSCSRIPHLRVHILSRQSRTKSPQTTTSSRKQQQRFRSSWVSLDVESANFSEPTQPTKTEKIKNIENGGKISPYTKTENRAAENVQALLEEETTAGFSPYGVFSHFASKAGDNARAQPEEVVPVNLYDVLQEGNPDRILLALLDPTIGHSFIRGADDEGFAGAFTLLDPRYLLEPFKDVFRFIKPSLYRSVKTLEERFESFATSLNAIILQRQKSGHRLNLDVYRYLLDCARVMGDGAMATHVINIMMRTDGVQPDLQSYNYYMEAICWSNAFGQAEKFRLRVTPRILAIRGSNNPSPDLSGHSVARPGQRPQRKHQALRLQTLNKFKQLVAQGLQGDEATFTNLMIAMGREGQLDDAKSILKSVWNIDVDLLGTYDEEEIEGPTFYEEGSPLRPSAKLLFTVAHVFGSNNSVGLAFSLVDYISRNYDLRIPIDVWKHLCEWTMILALKQPKNEVKQGQDIGKVKPKIFTQLWEAMTDKPHEVVPDVVLLMLHAKLKMDSLNLDRTLQQIRQAKSILEGENANLRTLTDEMVSMVEKSLHGGQWDGFLSSEFLDTRRRYLLASLTVDRDRHLITFFLRRFFTRMGWNNAKFRREWERVHLPRLIEEFAEYIPNAMKYTLRTGVVELQTKSTRNEAQYTGKVNLEKTSSSGGVSNRMAGSRWGDSETTGGWGRLIERTKIMRAALDVDDHGHLIRNIEKLPQVWRSGMKWCFDCEQSGHTDADCTTRRGRSRESLEKECEDGMEESEASKDGHPQIRDATYNVEENKKERAKVAQMSRNALGRRV